MEDELKDVFENTNRWLAFAEAKNCVLVAGNGALLIGIRQILCSEHWSPSCNFLTAYVIIGAFFSSLAIIFSLLALLPKTRLPWQRQNGIAQPLTDNLLFFGHISRYSASDYLKSFAELMGATSPPSNLSKAYSEQIVTNAKIAQRKYSLFKLAGWCTICAIGTPILAILLLPFVESD